MKWSVENMNNIYVVIGGWYSDWRIVGYFTDRNDAEKFCVKNVDKYDEPYVKTVDCLDGKFDVSDVDNLYYEYKIIFGKTGNGWEMRHVGNDEKKDPDVVAYCGNGFRSNTIYSDLACTAIVITVNRKDYDCKKAEKIAQDILYQYLIVAKELGYEKAMKLMNKNFSHDDD